MKAGCLTCIFVAVFCAAASGSAREEWASQALSRMSEISTRPSEDDFEWLCWLASEKASENEARNKVCSAAVTKLEELDNIENAFFSYLDKNKLKMDQQAFLPSAQRERYSVFNALGKLRHPDAVKVLGSMVSISGEEEERYLGKMIEHRQDYTLFPHDALLAARALYELIEDPPLLKSPSNYLLSDARFWSAWWSDIKNGDKAFSFKGQAVEYRFKPDGTWDTLPIANPPDDGPQSVVGTTHERPLRRLESKRVESPDSPVGQTGWWAILGGFALVVLGAWFWRKKSV